MGRHAIYRRVLNRDEVAIQSDQRGSSWDHAGGSECGFDA